ncbi:MAG: TRAP transporter substrate-binding protein DctP [Pseudomonadota bacterium]|nr:TRAP transporter substrate-binding protein DctP [Pseudomonadota bacterium]
MKTWIKGAGALGALLLGSTAAFAEDVTIRIGAGHPAALTYVQAWDEYFEEQLVTRAKELGHNVRLIEAWGTVARVDNVTETVASGALDIGLAIPTYEPSTLELFNFGNMMPFASTDPVLQARVINRMLQDLPDLSGALDDMGLTVLGMAAGENYGMALRDVPQHPEDIKGARIAAGAVVAPWVSAMGGIPVPLPVNENYQAMQSGLIDGNVFFISGVEAFKFYEVLDAFYQTEFGSLPGILFIMNNDARARLPEDLVALIDDVALEAAGEVGRLSAERDAQFADMLKDKIEIVSISAEDKQRWAEAIKPGVEEAVAEMDGRGLPASKIFGTYVAYLAAEGHELPVSYSFAQ